MNNNGFTNCTETLSQATNCKAFCRLLHEFIIVRTSYRFFLFNAENLVRFKYGICLCKKIFSNLTSNSIFFVVFAHIFHVINFHVSLQFLYDQNEREKKDNENQRICRFLIKEAVKITKTCAQGMCASL